MYTILENARIVISLLKKHNIRHIVISPGGSNIPIVQGVQNDPFFTCYSVVDERSAMYFAIGLYLELGEPVATSCTSAQATRNYLPGLTEAFYKHVPILAITMSKHPRYLMQEYMQCPIQTSLPVDAVKHSYSLPYISNANDRAQCIRVANEAMLELTHHDLGPVQLNIEELDNETWAFNSAMQLPDVRCIRRLGYGDEWDYSLNGKKIMVLIGEHRPFSHQEIEAIECFSASHNVLVYSDPISNYHGRYSLNANLLMASMSQTVFESKYKPDILITVGGVTGDYGIYFPLINLPEGSFEHWRVNPDGNVVDTYNKLTAIYEVPVAEFFKRLSADVLSDHSYYELWADSVGHLDLDIDIPFSNLYAAQQMHQLIPSGSRLHLAILNSLRVWSYFPLRGDVECYSNVAAFGIDGCLSTMLGQSVASEKLTFLVTGDLAFYYDMNALGIRHIKPNVRILLVNNNGGVEFKLGDLESRTEVGKYISAAGHFKSAKSWAENNGFIYLSASGKEEFLSHTGQFVGISDSPILFEIFTEPALEREANQLFRSGNAEMTRSEELKAGMKKAAKAVLGDTIVGNLKRQLRK